MQAKNWWTDMLLLTALIGIFFAFMLGSRPLNVPDEARYCEIGREILVTHDFVTPRINGIKYFEKPPLFYWMQAFALKTLGHSETACRLMDALMALLGCLGTYFTARQLFDRKTGLFAAGVLSTSLLYFVLAHVVTLDMTVSIWICFSLFSFILGATVSRRYFFGVYIFAALAVLTKGLIGIIFPGSIILLWLLFTRQWAVLKECYLGRGIVIFLAITLPWHVMVQLRNPEFFHFYIIDQQFKRYLTLEAHRYQPDWYYIPILLLGLFPWTGFLYGALKKIQWRDPKLLFLLLSATFMFIFFSLSKSKLVPYILPCFPVLAILIGHYFADKNKNPRYVGAGFITLSVICLAIVIAIPFALDPSVTTNYHKAKQWAYIISFILLINTITVPYLYYKIGLMKAFGAQMLCTVCFLFSLCATAPYIYMDSIKDMALFLNAKMKPEDRVVTYDYYCQDLPFYLNRTITIVNWDGELDFGRRYAHDSNLWIEDQTFWPLWNSPQTVYMMIAKDLLKAVQQRYPHTHFYPQIESKNDIVVVNHEEK